VIRTVLFHPAFVDDVREHAEWLEHESRGMGDEFLRELDQVLLSFAEMPERHRELFPPYRRVLIRRFSVLLPFRIVEDTIRVLGVVHGARDLKRWVEERSRS